MTAFLITNLMNMGVGIQRNQLKDTQYRDKVKDDYCSAHNIKMIRIPYWDYDILDKDYLLTKIS